MAGLIFSGIIIIAVLVWLISRSRTHAPPRDDAVGPAVPASDELEVEGLIAQRPIVVGSTAVIEAKAVKMACLRCRQSALRVEQHRALTIEGRRLRVVDVRCGNCGHTFAQYYRLRRDYLN